MGKAKEFGMDKIEVSYNYITGWVDECKPHFNRSIAQYKRYYKYVKIGITTDPDSRANQHEKCEATYKWERMIVIYKTASEKHANWIEGNYLDRDDFVNQWPGWSHMSPTGEYYVYLLLGNHKSRNK